jgi:hypothetical protein
MTEQFQLDGAGLLEELRIVWDVTPQARRAAARYPSSRRLMISTTSSL